MTTGYSNLLYLAGSCSVDCMFGAFTFPHQNKNINFIVAYSKQLEFQWAIEMNNTENSSIVKIISSTIASTIYILLQAQNQTKSTLSAMNINQKIIWEKSYHTTDNCGAICSTFAINRNLDNRIALIQNTINTSLYELNLDTAVNNSVCTMCPVGTYLGNDYLMILKNNNIK